MEFQFIQPGMPMLNVYIERFNRVYREAILEAYLFNYIREIGFLTEGWIIEYDERSPHEALQNRRPSEWKQQIKF